MYDNNNEKEKKARFFTVRFARGKLVQGRQFHKKHTMFVFT